MKISSNFDGGNIEVVDASDPDNIQLRIPKDTNSDFFQYFAFKASGLAQGKEYTFKILNAGKSSYPEGWKIHPVPYSFDLAYWQRASQKLEGDVLQFSILAEGRSVYCAYFPPYPLARHDELVAFASSNEACKNHLTGRSVEGRDVDLLQLGLNPNPKKKVWIIARQHPGETMAEWFMEGLIFRLLDSTDSVSRRLLNQADFFLVPNINPDGSYHGNLRTNAAGSNLNREWNKASDEKSPEVKFVLEEMDRLGVDLCLDIHGDEDIPYVFISGAEGNPGFTPRLAELDIQFRKTWEAYCPDFQTEHGYDVDAPGTADLSLCTNQVSERFDALALTIEMPFTDNKNLPDPVHGWSPERSLRLGESFLIPILDILPRL